MPQKIKEVKKVDLDEELVQMFGEDASEEFKAKAKTVFEAAVNAKVEEAKAEFESKVESTVEERLAEAIEAIEEQVDRYLTYVAEQWKEENELAIESSLKVEMAESLMGGLAQLFAEHKIEVDEEGNDVVEMLVSQNEELKEKLNEATGLVIELGEKLEAMELNDIVEAAAEGMTDTQVERLKTLAEGIKYKDVEDFKSKVETIRESLFAKAGEVKKDAVVDPLTEETDVKKASNPDMKRYLEAARRMA